MSLYAFRLGSALLLRAAGRCIRVADEVGGVALLIDAKNRAARWYEGYGALRLLDASLSLVLPLAAYRRRAQARNLGRPYAHDLRNNKTLQIQCLAWRVKMLQTVRKLDTRLCIVARRAVFRDYFRSARS
jgi:hypothetical protein